MIVGPLSGWRRSHGSTAISRIDFEGGKDRLEREKGDKKGRQEGARGDKMKERKK